jgi:hypothetical protein
MRPAAMILPYAVHNPACWWQLAEQVLVEKVSCVPAAA